MEPDGSVNMKVPALRSLQLVALDERDLSIKRMLSFLTVTPGECTSCTGCHEKGSEQADRGDKIQNLFLQAEDQMEKARVAIDDAKRIPLDVSDYETRLSDARTYLVEARPVSHDISVDDVEDLTRRARSIALEIQSEVLQKMGVFKGRTIVLLLVLFYILISIGVVTGYRRRLEARRGTRIEDRGLRIN